MGRSFKQTIVVASLLSVILSSCGGGGGGGGTTVPSYALWIVSPTSSATYQTQGTTISLSGGAFTPAGASCTGIIGTMPAGYQVSAVNAANGATAYTRFYLGCLLQVNVIWDSAPIPLEMGSNTITVTATDASGHSAQGTIVVTRVAETTPPTVLSTLPAAGTTGVSVNAAISISFSEAMDAATITSTTLSLKDSGNNPVAATVSYDSGNYLARLTPLAPLAYSASYTATVGTGAHDTSGNALATAYSLTFTTAASNDLVPPTVQSVSPASGSTCAATSGPVTATFSEDLDPATVSTTSFHLTAPGNNPVQGSVAYLNRTASFTPSAVLTSGAQYQADLTTIITDLAGNHMASPSQWVFTTTAASGVGTWLPTSLSGMPSARYGHVVAWTGSEMIITGGLSWDSNLNQYVYSDQYGRYNPATETWIVASGAPAAWYQTAVWSGTQMLVWGGSGSTGMVTAGSRYSPGVNTWTALSTTGQPTPRAFHTAVWTGSEMLVWGGWNNGVFLGDGARYNPTSDTWQPISTANAPSARGYHTAIWTGTEMIVWGGVDTSNAPLADGARYNPSTDTWTPLSTVGAPSARYGHAAAWSGSKMFIWGEMNGNTNTGGLYDPVANTWSATDNLCAPSGRRPGNIVWTGSRMVIWGGAMPGGSLDDGYEYDPATNVWSKITATGTPLARSEHSAVWTGSKVIYWGGWSNGTLLNTGGALTP